VTAWVALRHHGWAAVHSEPQHYEVGEVDRAEARHYGAEDRDFQIGAVAQVGRPDPAVVFFCKVPPAFLQHRPSPKPGCPAPAWRTFHPHTMVEINNVLRYYRSNHRFNPRIFLASAGKSAQ
jgi:hypothetical protein